MNKYYTDSTGNEVSLYELENEDMDQEEQDYDAEEAAYQYKFDQFIKRMFAEGSEPMSIQEIHKILKGQ